MTPLAEAVLREVALRRQVSTVRILSRDSTRAAERARQEIFSRLYAKRRGGHSCGAVYSLPQIGRWFGRHHTTVLFGIRAHEKRMGEGA